MTRPPLSAARNLLAAFDRGDANIDVSRSALAADLRALLAAWDGGNPGTPGERYECSWSHHAGVWTAEGEAPADVRLRRDDGRTWWISRGVLAEALRQGDMKRLP